MATAWRLFDQRHCESSYRAGQCLLSVHINMFCELHLMSFSDIFFFLLTQFINLTDLKEIHKVILVFTETTVYPYHMHE